MHRNYIKGASLFVALSVSAGAYGAARVVDSGGSGAAHFATTVPNQGVGAVQSRTATMHLAIGSGAVGTGGAALRNAPSGITGSPRVKTNPAPAGSASAADAFTVAPLTIPNLENCNANVGCNPQQCVCGLDQ